MTLHWLEAACATPDSTFIDAARARQGQLTKPLGSLGGLETIAIQLAGLQRSQAPNLDRVWISVFAGDHGVAAEGISAFPQAVTGEMVRNFANGGAAISVLARELGATLDVVTLGTVNDPGEIAGVTRRIIAPATGNVCEGPAMTAAQLDAALAVGAASVAQAAATGAQLFIGGEMGIGNTTAATALACALLDAGPDELAGAGTGLGSAGIAHKAAVVTRALALHRGPDVEVDADVVADTRINADAVVAREYLRRLGGFEIAALTGAFVAAAQAGVPVLVDGFITTAAALAAVRINPGVRPWLLFGHRSHERGHARLLQALDARPLLDLGLRLGEASGAAAAVPLLRLACALHNRMATFDQAGVSKP
ncbi:nicotinate-nucleotide--dimethylbenzimidazole phosphoribosyltransferase [Aerolutibacter ruishenii]|uniref:Nicotinate-nucleotide--dimethylbenzimidazole phosphoribosyltransferase n=1 Tax=Aerolutibacter ruishenii TaxID=686800 RepID=A0A562M2I8_9GAMM|nr:nicotinate-nucleotide--dimethylbenzimidazole phosphoribosyltransferase [Lysobacter ruishenii]TWI14139.1 nicotinate-nucleotide-dimethylbenzimidazole phosphoribosyltransferase [Lysobacter ruishenii]